MFWLQIVCSFEYHVVYSISYQVPVLYFNAYKTGKIYIYYQCNRSYVTFSYAMVCLYKFYQNARFMIMFFLIRKYNFMLFCVFILFYFYFYFLKNKIADGSLLSLKELWESVPVYYVERHEKWTFITQQVKILPV